MTIKGKTKECSNATISWKDAHIMKFKKEQPQKEQMWKQQQQKQPNSSG